VSLGCLGLGVSAGLVRTKEQTASLAAMGRRALLARATDLSLLVRCRRGLVEHDIDLLVLVATADVHSDKVALVRVLVVLPSKARFADRVEAGEGREALVVKHLHARRTDLK